MFEDEFSFDLKFLQHDTTLLTWCNEVINSAIRPYVRNVIDAKYFAEILHSHRNKQLDLLIKEEKIDWRCSKIFLASSPEHVTTPLLKQHYQSFKLKCFMRELPTLSILKTRRPDLYNNPDWTCLSCHEEETLDHL